MWLKISPKEAARFSFILVAPAILGALLLEVSSVPSGLLVSYGGVFAAGAVTAYLSGLAAIRALMGIVAAGRFFWFGVYCIAAGTAFLVFA